MTGEALRAHALALAAEHGVRVHECAALAPEVENGYSPCAHIEPRIVDTVPVCDVDSYLTCLHEIGHVALGRPWMPTAGGRLLEEARAWRWALDASLVEPDAAALAWIAEAQWGGHVRDEGGDPMTGGVELVADEDLAEYIAVWLRVVGRPL